MRLQVCSCINQVFLHKLLCKCHLGATGKMSTWKHNNTGKLTDWRLLLHGSIRVSMTIHSMKEILSSAC